MNILRQLSMYNAVSGNEMYLIPQLFPEETKRYRPSDMPLIDAIGNVTLFKKGRSSAKTIAVITHTDEAGFIVRNITDKGFLKFEEVGTIDPRVIISKKVAVGSSNIKGIIGMKAIHLQKKSERETVVPSKDLFIDIGAKNKADASKHVHTGDYISFATEFGELCKGIIKGKALDRMGIICAMAALGQTPAYDTYFIFTAQKHIGARGAMTALERIKPDLAFIVDAVETADLFKAKPHESAAALHAGAVLSASDKKGITDKALFDSVLIAADPKRVKAQISHSVPAASELGAVRSAYGGTRAALIGIPCRYTNTPVSLMAAEDIDAVSKLLSIIITEIDQWRHI